MSDFDPRLLLSGIEELSKIGNRVSELEFRKYIPLYSKKDFPNMTLSEITQLSNEFYVRFDVYEDIVIVNAKDEVIRTHPPMFNKLPSISKDYVKEVARFSRDIYSELPKFRSMAANGLVMSLIKTCDNDEYLKELNERSAHFKELSENPTAVTISAPKEEDVEEDDTDNLFKWE